MPRRCLTNLANARFLPLRYRYIYFRPKVHNTPAKPLRFVGKVAAVKTGFAFIDVTGYPSFFCPGSKFGNIVMKAGLKVRFEVVFSAKGQLADKVEAL